MSELSPSIVSIHAPARGATSTTSRFGLYVLVSIHAPARGATYLGGRVVDRLRVSIHAPARGATKHVLNYFSRLPVSIHAPARGATRLGCDLVCNDWVSIHAPARGATKNHFKDAEDWASFNPRSREGSDVSIQRGASLQDGFQSTLPRGERPHFVLGAQGVLEVSIHAPARGAT